MASWASKLPGKIARVAGMLALYEDTQAHHITADQFHSAVGLAPYFIQHARLCLDLMGANREGQLTPARDILEWLRRRKPDQIRQPFSVRDAQRGVDGNAWGPDGVTSETVHDAITVLVDRGWAQPMPEEVREGRGRRPSPKYMPHPLIWDKSWRKEEEEVSDTHLRSA